jgi:hypothetical protein
MNIGILDVGDQTERTKFKTIIIMVTQALRI